MASISITACSFYLRKKHSKTTKDVYNLNEPFSIKDENGNIRNYANCDVLFKDFFKAYMTMSIDETKKQSFQCIYDETGILETDDYKVYYTKICSGDYGSTSEIINSNTKEVKYKKNADDIDVKPFYVFVVLPKDNLTLKVQKGMLIFQNIGPYGIKTITTNKMQEFFSNNYGISIQCNCVAPRLFIERVLKINKINKISLIKNYKSKDNADNISKGYGTEVRALYNLDFSENQFKKFLETVRYASGGKYNLFEFEHIPYHNAKIQVKIGEHFKTINVHNIDKLSIIEDIPEEIKGLDGHPDKEKLIEYIEQTINDYLSEMVLTIGERELMYDE